MGSHRRVTTLALTLAAIALGTSGCRRRAAIEEAPPSEPARPASAAPVDQTLPGELAEGTDKAFGLPIPRRMRVLGRFEAAVFASGTLSSEQVANYVRERVAAERIETGPQKTVFSRAKIKAAPDRLVRIEVLAKGADTHLTVRDETPPPLKPGLSDAERWRELGLNPDGTPVDPSAFH